MKCYQLSNENHTTFEMCQSAFSAYLQVPHTYVTNIGTWRVMADDIFEVLDTVYDGNGVFLSLEEMGRSLDDSCLWYITYDGAQPADSALEINRILAVSVFRRNHGLKMAGMAVNRFPNFRRGSDERNEVKEKARFGISEHIRFISSIGWAEVSGRLEHLFEKSLPWPYNMIDPDDLIDRHVFPDISVDIDGFHYAGPLRPDESSVRKIAYGTIEF